MDIRLRRPCGLEQRHHPSSPGRKNITSISPDKGPLKRGISSSWRRENRTESPHKSNLLERRIEEFQSYHGLSDDDDSTDAPQRINLNKKDNARHALKEDDMSLAQKRKSLLGLSIPTRERSSSYSFERSTTPTSPSKVVRKRSGISSPSYQSPFQRQRSKTDVCNTSPTRSFSSSSLSRSDSISSIISSSSISSSSSSSSPLGSRSRSGSTKSNASHNENSGNRGFLTSRSTYSQKSPYTGRRIKKSLLYQAVTGPHKDDEGQLIRNLSMVDLRRTPSTESISSFCSDEGSYTDVTMAASFSSSRTITQSKSPSTPSRPNPVLSFPSIAQPSPKSQFSREIARSPGRTSSIEVRSQKKKRTGVKFDQIAKVISDNIFTFKYVQLERCVSLCTRLTSYSQFPLPKMLGLEKRIIVMRTIHTQTSKRTISCTGITFYVK